MKDLYSILEVAPSATPEMIRVAYKLLAKRYHPDNAETGSTVKFRSVKEAHDILMDPAQRAVYDMQSKNAPQAEPVGRRVWVNGIGWVTRDDEGPYPGDMPHQSMPQQYNQSVEDMMREAAAGVGHSLVDQMVDVLIQNFRPGGGRRR